jgi:hypothetical protein
MNFRQASGRRPERINTDYPFSNFLFVDRRYRSNAVLRRIFSLARKLHYKSLLIEEICEDDCDLLAEENRALTLRCPDFKKSTVHRLSFFACPDSVEPRREDFLGYAVFKSDEFQSETADHVYESVLRPFRRAKENNFVPCVRDYAVNNSLGNFGVNGVLYAQQNGLTYVCAHVSMRTVLSAVLPQGDVSYAEINRIAGIDHLSEKIGRGAGVHGETMGLKLSQIEKVLQNFGLQVPPPLINEPSHPLPDEYQKHLYGFIESGYPALVCFELSGPPSSPSRERHLIPVIGHTFNEDAWMPDAQRIYFGANSGYFPSEHWLSSYLVHDDNVGPYFCIPRHYLKQDNFRAVYGIQSVLTPLLPVQAETLGWIYIDWIRKNLPKTGIDWYDRFGAFAEHQSLVLRNTLISKADYLTHLRMIKSRQGDGFEPALISELETKLPEFMWMVEISAPELFSCSRRKFGEVILSATTPIPSPIDLSLFLSARLPGIVIVKTGNQIPIACTKLNGHSELHTRCL